MSKVLQLRWEEIERVQVVSHAPLVSRRSVLQLRWEEIERVQVVSHALLVKVMQLMRWTH